ASGETRLAALAFVALWCLSPAVAYWISQPVSTRPPEQLGVEGRERILAAARKSWRFFEQFVPREDNPLPPAHLQDQPRPRRAPDNFQDDPRPVVAHRTSPTNIGVYLLSAVAARDLGWTGTLDAVDRISATLATISDLERYRGHLYNWYDTRTRKPLEPRYVSPVDSRNLAGHLSVLAVALRERAERPIVGDEVQRGLDAALLLVRDALPTVPRQPVAELRSALTQEPPTTAAWPNRLRELTTAVRALGDRARALPDD